MSAWTIYISVGALLAFGNAFLLSKLRESRNPTEREKRMIRSSEPIFQDVGIAMLSFVATTAFWPFFLLHGFTEGVREARAEKRLKGSFEQKARDDYMP